MTAKNVEEEIENLVEEWNRSIVEKDLVIAEQLRDEDYSSTMPDGITLTKQNELNMISSPGHTIDSIRIQNLEVRAQGNEATALFENLIEGEYLGQPINDRYKYTISFVKRDGRWRAMSSSMTTAAKPFRQNTEAISESHITPRKRGLVPGRIRSWVKAKGRNLVSESNPSFQELAYIPYRPGHNFVIPQDHDNSPASESSELPIPPRELWLGYNYPVHGQQHVSKMLEIVYASDFSFKQNDRILDLGCGAGRMIRHLKELSEVCEIWGTDISAEHIYWCKQHLSPPFNFATTTKVPHLPFEDRSFQLIYCGSVFTHIDDLADAWLLELKRILAPGGRLYLTIHDNHTIEMFESGRYDATDIVRMVRFDEVYRESKDAFGMFTVGRDNNSQVFYDTEYFSKTVRTMFDIISITPEAYFYQTAFLLKRKSDNL